MINTSEKRVQDAFSKVHVPPAVAQKTLTHIESLHTAENKASCAQPSVINLQEARAPRASRKQNARRFIGALAACLVLVALVVGGGFYFLTPAAYVAIDVNPSLELGVNRLGLVSDAQALNSDGEAILNRVDVRWMSYEDALNTIKSELGSYTSSDSVVEITVTCDEQAWSDQLADEGRQCFDAEGSYVVCSHASSHERAEAHAAGMGIAKWRIYTQLVEAGVPLSSEEASEMSMRELYDLANQENVPLNSSSDTTSSGSNEAAGAQQSYGENSHSDKANGMKQHGSHHTAQSTHE